MRKFVVNVNGNRYEVEVEEVSASGGQAAPAVKPAETPVSKAAPAPKAAPLGPAGDIKISSPMPGTILDVKVNAGDTVKKGTVIAILEAMKMENEILAPQDATVASVNVSKSQQVNSGDVIMTLRG